VLVLAFLLSSFIELVNVSLALALRESLGLGSLPAGRFMARLLLAGSAIAVAAQAWGRRHKQKKWDTGLRTGAVALGLGVLLWVVGAWPEAAVDPVWRLGGAVACFSVGLGLIPPSCLTLFNQLHPGVRRGRRAGTLGSTQTLGYALGGGLASCLLKRSAAHASGALVALVLLIGLSVVSLRRRFSSREELAA
jgi:hypothetical protein